MAGVIGPHETPAAIGVKRTARWGMPCPAVRSTQP
jgi:hypothetical protein